MTPAAGRVAGPVDAVAAAAAPLLGRCTFPPAGTPLVCAVSGGPDSLALLVLATTAGCAVTAVHVDHALRPGSGAEARVVADAARRFGAAFTAEAVRVEGPGGPEASARRARYRALPDGVATGHTMDDQAETVLLNLLRGGALDGLAGMVPGPTHPILGLRRHETVELCRTLGLRPVHDPSNDDPGLLRNRVRHELLPLCRALTGRDPVPVLARQAALARDEAELLDRLAADSLPDPADARALAAAPPALARRAVRRWLRRSGVTAPAGGRGAVGHPPSAAEVARVLSVAAGGSVATELAGGYRVRRSGGRLALLPPADAPAPAAAAAPVGNLRPVPGPDDASGPPAWAGAELGTAVVTPAALTAKVAELGRRITEDYAGCPPLLVGVLKGAMIFMSDLCRAIELPVDVDFMAVSSYGSATRTSGVVRIVKDLDAEITGRHVLVVEDIIDSGLTLNYLRHYLQSRRPASVEVCALLVKEGEQGGPLDLRYVGFHIPPTFVVGYGLDVAERFRNLSGVYTYRGDADGPPAGPTRGGTGGG